MPRNVVAGAAVGGKTGGPKLPQLSEEQWRAHNMPASRLVVRWGYRNGQVQLLNRRMRNLAERNVGPAMCAWIRERVDWEAANRLHERPDGAIVVDVDPAGEGSVDVRVDGLDEPPAFTREMLDDVLPADLHPWAVAGDGRVQRLRVGAANAGVASGAHGEKGGAAHGEARGEEAASHNEVCGEKAASHGEKGGAGAAADDGAESAIDRFAADLLATLGFAVEAVDAGGAAPDGAGAADGAGGAAQNPVQSTAPEVVGYFATSEEWGLVPCAGDEGLEVVRKLAACFDTLWSGKAGV